MTGRDCLYVQLHRVRDRLCTLHSTLDSLPIIPMTVPPSISTSKITANARLRFRYEWD